MPEEGYTKRLTFADGTVLENCTCTRSGRDIWCFLKDVTFGEAFQYFAGPEKFGTLVYESIYREYTDKTTYSGIDSIVSIMNGENTVDVHLEGYKITVDTERILHNQNGNEA